MSMDSGAEEQISSWLAQRAGVKVAAPQVAETTAATWQAINDALTPIVGPRGVAALYKRSIHLNRHRHAGLADVAQAVQTSIDTAPLKLVLAQQSPSEAAAIGAALFQTFYELLTSLVGSSLTERLLRSVWVHFLSSTPAQDN